jgi:hypothetical protein
LRRNRLFQACVTPALILVGLSTPSEEPMEWQLVKVPVVCARYLGLADGMRAMMNNDMAAAEHAGCFKMRQPLRVDLVEEYDNGQVAKITYRGRDGRIRTGWTLRAFVERAE